MKKFAVLKDNVVFNTIIAETKEIAEEVTDAICIEYTDENPAYIGLHYNGKTFEKLI